MWNKVAVPSLSYIGYGRFIYYLLDWLICLGGKNYPESLQLTVHNSQTFEMWYNKSITGYSVLTTFTYLSTQPLRISR